MKKIKNKSTILFLYLTILISGLISNNTHASHPLSLESKKYIAKIAGVSAISGAGTAYLYLEFIKNQNSARSFTSKKTTEETKEKTNSIYSNLDYYSTILGSAYLAGLATGLLSYIYTPERTLEWLETRLTLLKLNQLLHKANEALNNKDEAKMLEIITQDYAKNEYPISDSLKALNILNKKIDHLQNHATSVIQSDSPEINKKSRTLSIELFQITELLQNLMIKLSTSQSYKKEFIKQYKISAATENI